MKPISPTTRLRQALALNRKDYEAMTYLGLSAEVVNFQDTAQQLYRAAIRWPANPSEKADR
ncbi:MAG TPA: hypothetical protein VFB14_26690 [Bryobacteraceae bacterium]|nr:hypothetical protein [Bryobacteraceae bacterium]